jgi:hypothetical protein
MKQVIKNASGSYFVDGQGFNAIKANATVFTEASIVAEKIACAKSFGVLAVAEDLPPPVLKSGIVSKLAALAGSIAGIISDLRGLTADGLDAESSIADEQATDNANSQSVKPVAVSKFNPTAAQQARIDSQNFSFGIKFTRSRALKEVRTTSGWKAVDNATVATSARYFGTYAEAETHAKRYVVIEKHKSFEIFTATGIAPNAWVNEATGKTNPVIGLKRTNR